MDSKTMYPYQVVRITRRASVVVLGRAMLYPQALLIAKQHIPTCGEKIRVERVDQGRIENLWERRGY